MTERNLSIATALRLLLLAWAVLVTACDTAAEQSVDAGGVRTESADPASGVRVSVAVERVEIETVDRLDVAISVVRPAGMGIGWTEPDWAADGWTRIDRRDEPTRVLADGLFAERSVVTLEPFLDGPYVLPPVRVAVGERAVTTSPIDIMVRSVLEEEDAGTLSEPLPTSGVQAETQRRGRVVAIVTLLGLAALVVVWRIRRGGSQRPVDEHPLNPMQALRVAADGGLVGSDGLACVHRAIDRLDSERPGLLRSLAERCERARFGPGRDEDARSIAREALARLDMHPAGSGRGIGGASHGGAS